MILFAGGLFLFGYIVHEVIHEKEVATDNTLINFISTNFKSNRLTPVMKQVTYFASASFLQIAYGALILLYVIRRDWKRCIEIAVIGLGGFAVNYFMKLWFQRGRPSDPMISGLNNFSFPSGHAMSGLIFYGLCAYLVWKTHIPKPLKLPAAILLILFSFLIGFSRIYLRVHYPTDVIAGFCVGGAWLLLIIMILEKLKKKSDRELTVDTAKNKTGNKNHPM